jgi:hypothetical protein
MIGLMPGSAVRRAAPQYISSLRHQSAPNGCEFALPPKGRSFASIGNVVGRDRDVHIGG